MHVWLTLLAHHNGVEAERDGSLAHARCALHVVIPPAYIPKPLPHRVLQTRLYMPRSRKKRK